MSPFGVPGAVSLLPESRPHAAPQAQETRRPGALPLFVHTQPGVDKGIEAYLDYLGGLLKEHTPGLWQHISNGRAERFLTEPPGVSTLFIQNPSLPLCHLLLVIRMEETDEAAAKWTIRLARESGAAVTILPIVPPIPALYFPESDRSVGLGGLLSPNTLAGAHVRRLLAQLACNHIHGTLRLREGEPGWQLRQEVAQFAEGACLRAYDLVVIGAESQIGLKPRLTGELVGPLLSWIDRPVLVTC